jgi:hypothetical protein
VREAASRQTHLLNWNEMIIAARKQQHILCDAVGDRSETIRFEGIEYRKGIGDSNNLVPAAIYGGVGIISSC